MGEAFNAVDGVRISFQESGAGPTIVLVHGSGLSRAIWRGLGYTKALEERFQVVTLDLRGHGRSEKPQHEDAYSMDLLVGDILAVLDAAGVQAAHYVGYSAGARVGFSLLASSPERVETFTSAGGTYRSPAGQIESIFFPGYDQALDRGGVPEFLRQWSNAAGRDVDPQTAAAFLANDPAALRAYFRRSEDEPGIPEADLRKMDTPTLLLAGTEDPLRHADSERAARLMHKAQFHALLGRNHGQTLTPASPVLNILNSFIRRK
ncbi:pimeloyl-ACP methyl ester carboxylesterase [Arthrobacter pascens]|uniref:alpha/beta fold hydrolase n=1 Tax=Arthrobacter pascens TaxID=1677 RepID=UPI002854D02D|nr:alpha/beta hydrolase [Arthrobacter pascens]MDR6558263.1 pimeloyl-ACP methyl ester carboxylesterase [Arthrobacter pascens]